MEDRSEIDSNALPNTSTLQLLEKYDSYLMERERVVENITKSHTGNSGRPSYDDLFKENVRLKMLLKDSQAEIETLKNVIAKLRRGRSAEIENDRRGSREFNAPAVRELSLPPRSVDRKGGARNLSLSGLGKGSTESLPVIYKTPTHDASNDSTVSISGGIVNSKSTDLQEYTSTLVLDEKRAPSLSKPVSRSSSSYSNNLGSPATSVFYKTSRISIASPARSTATSKAASSSHLPELNTQNPVKDILRPPLRSTKTYASDTSERQLSSRKRGENSESTANSPTNPIVPHEAKEWELEDIDPNIQGDVQKLNDIIDLKFTSVNSYVGHHMTYSDYESVVEAQETSTAHSSQGVQSPTSTRLGVEHVVSSSSSGMHESMDSTLHNPAPHARGAKNSTSPTSVQTDDISFEQSGIGLNIKTAVMENSETSTACTTTPISHDSASINYSNREDSIQVDIPLFVQPGDLATVKIEVTSTLYHEPGNQANILFSVIDKNSGKDIFNFAKTIDHIIVFNEQLKDYLEFLNIPPLPDRVLFSTNIPTRVDARREKLNDYFASLQYMSPLEPNAALLLAQFISTDPVMNPILGDCLKEGTLLVRKSKTLGSASTWRVRYCTVEGTSMHLADHARVTDTIRLPSSSIELQANLPDDKHGTKNGFIIHEHKKSGLSSTTKYYFCAETSKEREQWVSLLTGICETPLSSVFQPLNSKSEVCSLFDQTSISDSSIIGPIANLENTDLVSFTKFNDGAANTSPIDDDREIRRRRMKSFFPFKKLGTTALPYSSGNDNISIFSQDEEGNSSFNTVHDNSIARSLQSMNLHSSMNTVFGSDLGVALELSSQLYQRKYRIPSIVFRCLEYIYKNRGIYEEGIFRLSGSSSLIKSLQEQFDKEYDVDLCEYNKHVSVQLQNENQGGLFVDVNTVTGLLKLYLRKLPHMLFGDEAYIEFKKVVDKHNGDDKAIALEFKALISSGKIPKENISLMYALFELLVKINDNSKINKMNLRNLCIVFSPTLNIPVNIVQPFIVNFGCIFKDQLPQESLQAVDICIPHM